MAGQRPRFFYDLIPIRDPRYALEQQHRRYLTELLRVDAVLAISKFSRDDLLGFLRDSLQLTNLAVESAEQRIVPVRLPESLHSRDVDQIPAEVASRGSKDAIVMLGLVEPRKQQVRVVKAYQKLRIAERTKLRMFVIGSLHPLVAREFETLIAHDPNIEYLGYASERKVAELFRRSRFSVFASNMEGYGLPIAESLAHGVPCLTANFDAMLETAAGGGCVTVNVDDDHELERGLLSMALDDALIAKCRSEIRARVLRTWGDYVRELVDALTWPTMIEKRAIARARLRACGDMAPLSPSWKRLRYEPGEVTTNAPDLIIDVMAGPVFDTPADEHEPAPSEALRAVFFTGAPDDLSRAPPTALERMFSADAWFCKTKAVHDRLVALAEQHTYEGMLPTCCGWEADREKAWDRFCDIVGTLPARKARHRLIALREEHYQAACKNIAYKEPGPAAALTIIISTYNAGHFLERNIEWILRMIAPLQEKVRLVVADNASTDDTPQRMERFLSNTLFEYVRVPANTGLLGNLNFCATLFRARHVWIIGADDIVVPGAIADVLTLLEQEPGCPFIFPNFGVYYRSAIGAEEQCSTFVEECTVLGRNPDPTGIYTVKDIARQHDNLFTAFYAIIFRSDIMAAVFNSPFTGRFFGSVMDTVPSTEVILQNFPEVRAIWRAEPAIVGNGHNTWRENRVAWHAVIMPHELARQAGVRPDILRQWSKGHIDLFREAESLFPDPQVATRFGQADLDASFRVFRQHLLKEAPSDRKCECRKITEAPSERRLISREYEDDPSPGSADRY